MSKFYNRGYGRIAKQIGVGGTPEAPYYVVDIPEAPEHKRHIMNWDLPQKDQKWRCVDKQEEFDGLPDAEKPGWMAEEVRRRKEGFWFFCNGIATWITGHHYFYLQYMMLEGGIRPEYRERDTKFFYVWDFCEKDDECQGLMYPKMRREGATSKAVSIIINTMTLTRNDKAGIQSQTEVDAKSFFLRLVDAYFDLPTPFRPQTSGTTRPQKKLEMYAPSQNITHKNKDKINQKDNSLKNTIDFRSTDKSSYDGHKMKIYIHDEAGKIKTPNNIIKTWAVVGKALRAGRKILGKALIPSTVGEMSKDGGVQFQKLWTTSDKDELNKNNRTPSGLYRLFMTADEGYEGFIGEYGESITGPPTPAQLEYLRSTGGVYEEGVGSRQYIINSREGLDPDQLDEEIRQFPLSEAELFRWADKESPFNIKKIHSQKEFIQENPEALPFKRYRLRWKDNVRFSKVEAIADPDGKFVFRWMPPNSWLNRVDERRKPMNGHRFAAGVDPFGIDVVKGKGSNCAASIFMYENEEIDGGKDAEDITKISDNFFARYVHRAPTTSMMNEDILMMLWFFGCPAIIERNKTVSINFFKKNRLSAFGLDRPNNTKSEYSKGRVEDMGVHSDSRIIQQYTINLAEHFENNYRRYWDFDGLEDMEEFDPKKTQKSDETVSKGFALIAAYRRNPSALVPKEGRNYQLFRTFDKVS